MYIFIGVCVYFSSLPPLSVRFICFLFVHMSIRLSAALFCFVLLIFAMFDSASFCCFVKLFICSFPFLRFSFLSSLSLLCFFLCFLNSLLLAQCSQLLLTMLHFSEIQHLNRKRDFSRTSLRFFGDFIASMGAAVPTSAL